jgi:hypothetical protein
MSANGPPSGAPSQAGPPRIPALQWEQRSDWINVRADITPMAIGDGRADDTSAIQKALNGLRDGSVLYFPPGVYRITAPLILRNSTGSRWIGGLIVGSGRDTRWVWDGASGGTMLVLNGVAYSRFVGFELDGRDWGEPVVKGEFAPGRDLKMVAVPRPVTAKFLKLVAPSGFDAQPFASLAEFEVER